MSSREALCLFELLEITASLDVFSVKVILIKAVAYLNPDPKEWLPRKEVDTGSASYKMGSYSKQKLHVPTSDCINVVRLHYVTGLQCTTNRRLWRIASTLDENSSAAFVSIHSWPSGFLLLLA